MGFYYLCGYCYLCNKKDIKKTCFVERTWWIHKATFVGFINDLLQGKQEKHSSSILNSWIIKQIKLFFIAKVY